MFEKIIFATHNKGKLEELNALFSPFQKRIDSVLDYEIALPEETGTTFEENAFLKASYIAKKLPYSALADDSGLEISVLENSPGVYSANWALLPDGTRNYEFAMKKIYKKLRKKDAFYKNICQAKFVSVFCFITLEGETFYFRGETDGEIVWPPRGNNGFGYDPIFQPSGYKKTFAQMSSHEKLYGCADLTQNIQSDITPLSHRARALKKMLDFFER